MNAPLSRVLVVEDIEEDGFILTQLLQRAGVNGTTLYRTGEAAVEWLETLDEADRRQWPSAVFLDVMLPGMGGFEVLRWLRAHAAFRGIPVVLLSGGDEPRNLGKALQLGADAYIIKYPTISALREVVAQVASLETANGRRPAVGVACNLLLDANRWRGER